MDLSRQQDLIEAAATALTNTQNSEQRLLQLMRFGFGPAQFQEGKKLLHAFVEKDNAQTKRQNEQWALSQQLNASLEAVDKQFRQHVRIVRVALRDDKVLLHSLKIDKLATRRWECVRQATYFYDQLLEQEVALDAYNISAKEVQQARKAAHQLLETKKERADKKSLAEQSTQEKRQAQKALHIWVKDFRTMARMAFREEPQVLEAFGITVPTTVG